MSQQATISDVAQLVRSGEIKQAKQQARALLDSAQPRDLELIAQCADIVQNYPRTAVDRLRWMWQHADAHGRDIIAACAPAPGETYTRPDDSQVRAPRWTRRNRYQAPSTVTRRVRPELRRRPARTARDTAVVIAYDRERAGIDDQPEQTERPDGYVIDYERAALPSLRGAACLSCWIERAAADRNRRPDDGLCAECRDAGRRGIEPLPAGHTRAEAIAARCEFIATTHRPATARTLLRVDWQHATDRDRAVIAAWVHAHPIPDIQPAESGPESDPCATCGHQRRPRDTRHVPADDGQCTACRQLDPTPATSETHELIAA